MIDLRCTHEVALSGRYREEGVEYHHLPFGDLLGPDADWEAWSDPAYVAGRYFELCFSARESISEAFAILSDPGAYPAVIHCSIGKDRTGVLIALVMRALGVPVDAIVQEYALSQVGAARIVERLRAQIRTEDQHDLDPYLPALLAAEPETMRTFFRLVCDEFGSVTAYLRHLGIAGSVQHLRTALLE